MEDIRAPFGCWENVEKEKRINLKFYQKLFHSLLFLIFQIYILRFRQNLLFKMPRKSVIFYICSVSIQILIECLGFSGFSVLIN